MNFTGMYLECKCGAYSKQIIAHENYHEIGRFCAKHMISCFYKYGLEERFIFKGYSSSFINHNEYLYQLVKKIDEDLTNEKIESELLQRNAQGTQHLYYAPQPRIEALIAPLVIGADSTNCESCKKRKRNILKKIINYYESYQRLRKNFDKNLELSKSEKHVFTDMKFYKRALKWLRHKLNF